MKYTVFVGFRYQREWYTLSESARREFHAEHVQPIIEKYASKVKVRSFSTSSLETRFTNFLLVDVEDLKYYYFFIEALRDSPLLAQSMARITKFFVGIEDGYAGYEESLESEERLPVEAGR